MSDFYGYSQAEGISQGNAVTDTVKSLNDSIRVENEGIVNNAKAQKSQDIEQGIFGGAKDAFQEANAASGIQGKVEAYQTAVGKIQEGVQKAGDTVSKVKQAAQSAAPEAAGEESATADAATAAQGGEASAAAAEGTSALEDAGKTALNTEAETVGSKVAGAIGKGAGAIGALGSATLAVRDDVKSFEEGKGLIAGDNLEEKIANIGTIGGTALDMLGFVPGFQLAGVIGTAFEGASGLLDVAGQAQQDVKAAHVDAKQPQLQQSVVAQSVQQASQRVV